MKWTCFIFLLIADVLGAQSVYTPERIVTKIAEGIYVIQHKDGAGGRIRGNTTVIIGDKDVMVVDAPGPDPAREDIVQIRQWTNKPVRYLINTHWHPDHNRGNAVYMKAFPGLSIIAHKNTATLQMAYEPGNLERLKKRYASGSSHADTVAMIELKDFSPLVPNVLFDSEMSIDLGNRKISLQHPGPADTKGDVVISLPEEKILIAGDLIVYPVPFFLSCYPFQWIKVLEKINETDWKVIVPGHGKVFYDKSYPERLLNMMKTIRDQVVNEVHQRGSLSAQVDDILKLIDISGFRKEFAGDNPDNIEEFDTEMAALIRLFFNQLDK